MRLQLVTENMNISRLSYQTSTLLPSNVLCNMLLSTVRLYYTVNHRLRSEKIYFIELIKLDYYIIIGIN